jgi:hypothetical protein
MPGLTNDQVAAYKADMYKAEREAVTDLPPVYPDVYKVIPNVEGAGDKYTQLLGSGRFKRHTTENEDIDFKAPLQGWQTYCVYHTYSAGLLFSKNAIEDVNKKKISNMLMDLASQWKEYAIIAKEELAARVFNHGSDTSGDWAFLGSFLDETDSSGLLLYDSKPLFALTGNEHTNKGGGSYYNSVASLTMCADDFETIYNLLTATNNHGEEDELKKNPVNTILCEPGSDHFKAKRIINTDDGMPGTQLNDLNPYYKIIDKIIPWDYLAASGGYYVGRRQDKNWEFRERQDQETDFFRDHINKSYLASCDMRFGIMLKPECWRAWARAGGATVAGGATE